LSPEFTAEEGGPTLASNAANLVSVLGAGSAAPGAERTAEEKRSRNKKWNLNQRPNKIVMAADFTANSSASQEFDRGENGKDGAELAQFRKSCTSILGNISPSPH
jgi:hypothetical protein